MKKRIVIVVGVILLLLTAFLSYIAMQPLQFRISRSATIHAPTSVAFARVNDFRNWEEWSPWAKLDPKSKVTFEGSEAGKVGSVFTWAGNDKVGEGRMTLVESKPDRFVRIRTDFIKPFEGTSDVEFVFTPGDSLSETKVNWSMSGENNFVGRIFCFFISMDKIVGGSMEEGFVNMDKVAMKDAQTVLQGTSTTVPSTMPESTR